MDSVESAYKELFGEPQFMMFVDESYETLRQQVISSPYCKINSNKLPFEGVNFCLTKEAPVEVPLSNNNLRDLPKTEIYQLLSSLREYLENKETKSRDIASLIYSLYPVALSQKHIFLLYCPNCCRAYGYYKEATQEFVILKGSLVARSVGATYTISPRGTLRNQFIKSYCKELKDYYIIHTDTVCKSASMAASFVLGRVGSIKRWIDKDGKTLLEVYSLK